MALIAAHSVLPVNNYVRRYAEIPSTLGHYLNMDNSVSKVMRIQARRQKIPKAIRQKVGDGSVDILPFHISYLFYNSLNYNPRPVFQSHMAYSRYLDSWNATNIYLQPHRIIF